ncbi:MAG: hypothetical protein VXZ82_11850 [Planctomycetota bacterium]|nr:hypothetical protein [Planctomycetota bacterium]
MSRVLSFAAAAMMLLSSVAVAEDVKSGLNEGDRIGAFNVVKCAGAEDDKVAVGKELCYRCKNGSRPQVMVFTRSTDAKLQKLVQGLDKAIAKNEDAQLRAFVNVLGDSSDAAEEEAKKLAKSTKAENIPFVVPNEFENGPDNYGINPKAELTIIFANESKVVANYAVGSIKDMKLKDVMGHLKKIIN